MQGIESLNNFKSFVSTLGGLGRFEDTYMVHAAEGETVVPMEVLNSNPLLKERLFESMRDMGIQPERYIVGNKFNSINPVTGQPEFFLKQIGKRLRKAAADISGYAAPVVGAMFGAPAGAATGALLGQYKRENPGDPNQALRMALLGGASGVAGNLARGRTGMDLLTGGGYGVPEGLGGIFTGARDLITGGYGSARDLITSGYDKFKESKLLGKLTGSDQMSKEEIIQAVKDQTISPEVGEFLLKNRGGNNKLLLSLLGLGGTLGLGKLIGEPEDITVDPSKMRTAPIETGQVFSPTQPVTVDTGYNIPITPYQAAEGGIIGYREGGFTGNPHIERPDRIPFSDEMKDQMYDLLFDFIIKERMREQRENEGRLIPVDPNAPIEAAGGGIVDFFKSFFKDPVQDPVTGEGTVSTLQRKRFEMLQGLKESGLDYDEQEYLKLKELLGKADGGVMDLRRGGASNGPGTGTSDSIPAMLSDGEFVMTAKAVRGAGGGDRREGARKMYEAMDKLEAQV